MRKISPVPPSFREDRNVVQFFEEVREVTVAASPIADLNQTIAGPSTAEVQAISDKVDEILAALRTSGKLET